MRDSRSIQIESLGSLRLQPNAITVNPEQLRHPRANHCRVRADLWSGQNEAGVDVGNAVSGFVYSLQRLTQKDYRVGAFPLRIRGWKQRSNIRRCDRPQQRVGNGVQQHVTIGVTTESLVVLESNPPDLQRNAGAEFMGVEAISNAGRWLCGRWSAVFDLGHSLLRVIRGNPRLHFPK